MSVNPPEGTLTIENSHLDVKGNVSAVALKLGTLRLTPSYGLDAVANVSNSTTHTLELSNATTGLVTTANVVVGGELAVTGNATVSSNLTVSGNATVSSNLTVSGDATVTGDLNVSGDATVSSNLEVGTANLFVDTTTGGVGVGTTNPEGGLHISGKTFILGQISTVPTGPDGAMYYNSTLNQAFIKAGGSWISLTPFAAPTSISGLVGWYLPENWTGSQWTDVSGSGNHVTTYSGSILYDSSHNGETNGAGTTFPVLYGSTSATMNFPSAILPSTYTLVSVTRYNGGTRQRILNGSPNNWLSGHHSNKSGVAFHDGWLTTEVDRHGTKWVIGVDQNSLYRSKSQSTNWETNTGGGGTSTNLRINTGASNEPSDWMCAELMVYNRTLTYEEYRKLTDYIQNKYVIY